MSIDRITDYNDRDWFRVSEQFGIYDGITALALDHLLSHIKLLQAVATLGVYLTSMADALSKYPRYNIPNNEDEKHDLVDDERLARVLEDECSILLRYLVKISAIDYPPHKGDISASRANKEKQKAMLFEEMKERIPFIDLQNIEL